MKYTLLFAIWFLTMINGALALTEFREISSREQLPQGMKVESLPSHKPDLLETVRISFRPSPPEAYRDRVKVSGHLEVKFGERTIAISRLEAARKDGAYHIEFQLARDAFDRSELTLSAQLYEEDGHPTVGGGEIYKLRLSGFRAPIAR